jgi:hypothetical protein
MEKRWPGILQAWILHHVEYLGFDHFSLYDVDGSAHPHIQPLLDLGFLSYFQKWAYSPCARKLALTGHANSHVYCSETLMNNHCMWQARGVSEWAILIHAPDVFVNDIAGAPKLFGLLDSLEPQFGSLMLPTYVFETPGQASLANHTSAADLFSFFTTRACAMLLPLRQVPVFDPHMVSVTYVHEPFDYDYSSGRFSMRIYTAAFAVHHYMQMFSSRMFVWGDDWAMMEGNALSPAHCSDMSMTHASFHVRALLMFYNNSTADRSCKF